MCCISTDTRPRTCCCGCSLLCGVLFFLFFEVLSLIGAITSMEKVFIGIQGAIVGVYALAFICHKSVLARSLLFYVYIISMLVFLVSSIYIASTGESLFKWLCE